MVLRPVHLQDILTFLYLFICLPGNFLKLVMVFGLPKLLKVRKSSGQQDSFRYKTTIFDLTDMFKQKLLLSSLQMSQVMQI